MPFFSPINVILARHSTDKKNTANTTVLRIVCCHQFSNVEKTGIVKRKKSIAPLGFTVSLFYCKYMSIENKLISSEHI